MTIRSAGEPPELGDEVPRPSVLRRLLPYSLGVGALAAVVAGALYFGSVGGGDNNGFSYTGPRYVNSGAEWYDPDKEVPFAPQTLVVESYSPDELVGLVDAQREAGMATFVAYTVDKDPRCTGLMDNNTELGIGNKAGDYQRFVQSCEDKRLLVVVPDLTATELKKIEKNLTIYNPFEILRQSPDRSITSDRTIPYALPVGNVGRGGKDLPVVFDEINGQTYLIVDKGLLHFLKSDIVDQSPQFPVRQYPIDQ